MTRNKKICALLLCSLLLFLPLIAGLPDAMSASAESMTYHSPFELAYSPDGSKLAVSDETMGKVLILQADTGDIQSSIDVQGSPRGLLWDGNETLYVAEYNNGTVAQINMSSSEVARRIIVGSKPVSLAKDGSNNLLVTEYGRSQLVIVDLSSGEVTSEVEINAYPFNLDVAGHTALIGHLLPTGDASSTGFGSTVSIINTQQANIQTVIELPQGTSNVRELTCTSDGQWAYVVHTLGKTSIPTTHITKGWVNTNALTIIDINSSEIYATVLLDRLMEGAGDPWGVQLSPDNDTLWVSVAGTHQIIALEMDRLHELLSGNVEARNEASYYSLKNKASGKYLDVPGKNTNNDVQMIQWDGNNGDNQKWKLVSASNGYKYIISKHSGKALDVKNSTNSGDAVVQYSHSQGSQSQQWKLESVGNNLVKIENRYSGMVMDNNGSNSNGADMVQNQYSDAEHQKWVLELVEDGSLYRSKSGLTHPYSDVWYKISEDDDNRKLLSKDLGALYSAGLMKIAELPGQGPRGMSLSPDGNSLAVAAYFEGEVYILDAQTLQVTDTYSLGNQPEEDSVRRGERKFHDASSTTQKWLSCATCHAEGRSDGLNWDLLNDGMGNPKNSKSMLATFDTPPVMSHGVRDNAGVAVAAGFKHIKFMTPTHEDLMDVSAYLQSLKPEVSPFRNLDGTMTSDAEAGKTIFNSSEANCGSCHSGEFFTDLEQYDVGTENALDSSSEFDTPTLLELWRSAPYLHDGSAATIREVLTTKNSGDSHGKTSHLTEEELKQLEAYLLQLEYDVDDNEAPSVPVNLVESSKTSTTISLTWDASTDNIGVAGYKVFINDVETSDVTETNYEASNLSPTTQYSFKVKAYDGAGNESELSEALLVTTAEEDTEAPTVPGNLVEVSKSTTTINISWDASTDNIGVAGYKVFVDDVETSEVTETNYEAVGLNPDTTYSFKVVAYDEAGNQSGDSQMLQVTTDAEQTLVDVAVNKTASADSTQSGRPANHGNDGDLSTRWCANNGDENHWWKVDLGEDHNLQGTQITWEFEGKTYGYTIESSTDDSNWQMVLNQSSNDSTMQVQKEMFTGKGRYIKVTVTSLESGSWASFFDLQVYGTPAPDEEAPSVPENLQGSNIEWNQLDLQWDASTDNKGVDHYKVYQDGNEIGVVSHNNYHVEDLTEETQYIFTVCAVDEAGNESALSEELQVTTPAQVIEPVYLSDLNWNQVENGWGNAEADRSNGEKGDEDGNTITLNGTTYSKGIGAHANSVITYDLAQDTYINFQAYVGVDDEVGNKGSIVFEVWGDDELLFQSQALTGESDTVFVDINIEGKTTLKLVITDNNNGNAFDHGDWADAQLTR